MSARRIAVTESESSDGWATPGLHDAKGVPYQRDGKRKTGKARPTLTGQTRDWPTPTAQDSIQSGAAGYSTASGRHTGTTLTDATVGPAPQVPRNTDGSRHARLNPRWVAQLMGYPENWLARDGGTN